MRNFRCYKDETAIDFDDITALVGRNDSGKSSIMDALNIFLNDGAPDKDDASKDGAASDLAIICEFEDFPDETVLDDTNPTSLGEEYLINTEGRLEIHKLYSGQLLALNVRISLPMQTIQVQMVSAIFYSLQIRI